MHKLDKCSIVLLALCALLTSGCGSREHVITRKPMASSDLPPGTLGFQLKKIVLAENNFWTAEFAVQNTSREDIMLPLLPGNEILSPTVQIVALERNQWRDVTPLHDSSIPLSRLAPGNHAVLKLTLPFKRGQEPQQFRIGIYGQWSEPYAVRERLAS